MKVMKQRRSWLVGVVALVAWAPTGEAVVSAEYRHDDPRMVLLWSSEATNAIVTVGAKFPCRVAVYKGIVHAAIDWSLEAQRAIVLPPAGVGKRLPGEAAVPIHAIYERGPAQAAQTSDDVVLQWNEIAVATIGAQAPFPSTRFMATVELAVFEAVNAITGKYEPYLGTIAAPAGASTEAAAITAAHGVLKAFFPAAATTLDQHRDASLAVIPAGQAKTDGIAVGEAAAAAMIAERTGDGSSPAQFYNPVNSDPYEWQRTPSCPPAVVRFCTGETSGRSAS